MFGIMLASELMKPLRQHCTTLVYRLLRCLCTRVMLLLPDTLVLSLPPTLQKLEMLPLRNRLISLLEHCGATIVVGL